MHDGTSLDAAGGDAVSLVVLLQAQLLLVQVHRGGVDPGALQVQSYPLAPQPPGETHRGEGSAFTAKHQDSILLFEPRGQTRIKIKFDSLNKLC